MVVEATVTRNGYGCDLSRFVCPKIEATDDDKDGLLLESGGGGSRKFGEGTSAVGLRIYTRRKRRKISNSNIMEMSYCTDKIKVVDNNDSDQDAVVRLSSEAFSDGRGECSLRHCRKLVLQKMYHSLNGIEDGVRGCIRNALLTHSESGGASLIKVSLDPVDGSVNQTQNSVKEHAGVMSNGLLKESENSTRTELCRRAFFDILMSEKFSELCGLLLTSFGDANLDRLLDVNVINSRMIDGAYETLPLLYLTDIQQVWMKLQKVGNEMVALAMSLSDKSRSHYEQLIGKEPEVLLEPRETEARGVSGVFNCRGCGEKADVRDCLVCDSCEKMYHVSCTELSAAEIPSKSWYCANCVSNGIGSPHDNCVVCEKVKSAPTSLFNGILTNEDELEDISYCVQADASRITDGGQSSKVCFICKSEVKNEDNFRKCRHSLCAHKFYHYKCLTGRQLGEYGPCWYCPSCLCQGCLEDKDDDQIVLCDICDHAYHIYCMSPSRASVPKGSWICVKCDRDLKRIQKVKRAYENMQKKVKIEEKAEDVVDEGDKSGGLDMLVTAVKTLSRQENVDDETR